MRSPQQNFLVFLAFSVGFVLCTLGETEWLRRRTKAGTYFLLLATFTSNVLSLILSYFLSFIIYLISVMAFGARDSLALWLLIFVGGTLAVTAIPLAIVKRLVLKLAKINGLPRPWSYAVVAAVAFQLSALALPFLVALFA